MAITQIRGGSQVMDGTIVVADLQANFLAATTLNVAATNDAHITGLGTPTLGNEAVNKDYVDGIVNTAMKAPDGFATDAGANYPSDYKLSGTVLAGDTFYITSVAAGSLVGTATVNVGDFLVALIDTPANVDGNWAIMESNRDQATEAIKGVAAISTQGDADAGLLDTVIITPLKLATYIGNLNIDKIAGAGMTETTGTFNVIAADLSLSVAADNMQVNIGTTNGTSLEVSATGLELAASVTGPRSFDAALNEDLSMNTSGTGTIILSAADKMAQLAISPTDNATPLAIATTGYVNSQLPGAITASNGLTRTLNNIALGGPLTANTLVNTGVFDMTFSGTGDVTLGGANVILDAGARLAVLTAQPVSNIVPLAIATTDFVDSYISGGNGISVTSGVVALSDLTAATTIANAGNNLQISGTGDILLGDGSVGSAIVLNAEARAATLATQPADNTVPLAIATTQFVVDNAYVATLTRVSNELPAVTNGSAVLPALTTLGSHATDKVANVEVHLNGMAMAPGAGNDYTIDVATGIVTFTFNLVTNDVALVHYDSQDA